MLDLKDVFYFVQVVDHGGFTAAAQVLRLRKSTLSHRVQALENHLGVRLLNRTPRQLSLSEMGSEFYRHALDLLKSSELAEALVRQRLSEPSGVIRLTTTVEIAQFALCKLLPAFLELYPKVSIVETATDKLLDIVGEGLDLALRGHSSALQNSNLIQQSIARVPWCLFAGRSYLERTGLPQGPANLAQHAIISVERGGDSQWRLCGPDGGQMTVPIEPRVQSNNMITLKKAACANLGIVALPGYICRDELNEGTLRQVLPGWIAADARISVLIPSRRGMLPAVRSLVDFLAAEIPKVTAFEHG